MPRYEYSEGTSNKFWEIELAGKAFTCRFGKIGANGQTQRKDFATPAAAKAAHDKLIAEKTKKGYALAGGKPAKGGKAAKAAPPAPAHARDAKLEAAIAADPDDADAYLVYADWLQGHGDPRGELIVLQHANKPKQANKLIAKHGQHFLGPVAELTDLLEPSHDNPIGKRTTWRCGYLEALWLGNKHEYDEEFGEDDGIRVDLDKVLAELLDHPSARFLRELSVGINSFMDNSYSATAAVIGKRRLPLLRRLVLGDFYYEETELNWSDAGNMQPIYAAVPNLESLVLRSGSMKIGKIDLPKLKELTVITGGLDKKSLENVCAAKWPVLEKLGLQTGMDGNLKLKHVQPVLDGKAFPKVKHLGLGNCKFADALCEALASSTIAARLESLDLSLGQMGDAGATALAAGKFPKLQHLDVSRNFITKKGLALLKPLAKKLVSERQENDEGDLDNRYLSGYE